MESSIEYRVIRSARRTRTVQARIVGNVAEIRIPARFTQQQEREAVQEMLKKLQRKVRSNALTDDELHSRAQQLNRDVLKGRAKFSSIRWVSNQQRRWGSCSVGTGEIRISHRLQEVPDYVLDAVIVHELTHTFIANHSKEFYAWADRAPQAERAKGYLEAYQRFGSQ